MGNKGAALVKPSEETQEVLDDVADVAGKLDHITTLLTQLVEKEANGG